MSFSVFATAQATETTLTTSKLVKVNLDATDTVPVLEPNNWAPATYERLVKLIEDNSYTEETCTYGCSHKPYAVFDFDNTTVINDVEEALLIYQLENLRFAIKPEQMLEVLTTAVPTDDFISDYTNTEGMPLNVVLVAEDCAMSYQWLYENYEGFNGQLSLEEIKTSAHYLNFCTKVRFLYDAIGDTFDASVSYPWVTYLFTGMTPEEVQALAVDSNDYWLDYGVFTKVTWVSPEDLETPSGVVSVSYKTGIAFPEEMVNLYNTLMANEIEVYVCSASFIDVILTSATNPKYGLNVKPENVYAMRLQLDEDGCYMNAFDDAYFQTQGKGKSHTINAFIRGQHCNNGPILVAGDSKGDYNMITEYDDMQVGLIVNRCRKDSFYEISQIAADTLGEVDAKYILQGRDENTGVFIPREESLLLGKTEYQLLK